MQKKALIQFPSYFILGCFLEYPLDQEEAERLKRYYESRGKKVKLVWMTPDEFLARVPHRATTAISQLADLRAEWFDKTSLGYLRKAFLQQLKLPPLMLDYSRMWFGWPTHEGRHRAYLAKMYGIEKVPVLVIGEFWGVS